MASTNLELNEPVLEPNTFDCGDPLESNPPTSTDAEIGLDIEEEDGGESNGSDVDFDDDDMEEDYWKS